jgi:hypothetical protein
MENSKEWKPYSFGHIKAICEKAGLRFYYNLVGGNKYRPEIRTLEGEHLPIEVIKQPGNLSEFQKLFKKKFLIKKPAGFHHYSYRNGAITPTK